jgi:hypothetical protein
MHHRFRSDTVIIPICLALLTLYFMLPFIRPPTGGEVLDGDDLVNQQYPLLSFIFDSVRNGQGLPLWNPYQFAGQSIVGNPQSTIYYPPAWLMVLGGVPKGVGWLTALHLWLGGWGMVAFTQQLGANRLGALIGGIVYEFSALLPAHLLAGHFNYLLCQAWLPWMATAYLWSLQQQSWFRAGLPGAAAVGLCILTGHPPMLYFGIVWLVILWIYASLIGVPRRPGHNLRCLLMMLLGGALLGAALLLPVAEFTLRASRTQTANLGFSNSFALPAAQLLTLLIPNLFGQPRLPDQGYWGLPFYHELTAYMGILPLVAIFRARRRPATTLLTAFVVIGIILSIGIDGGLFPWLYQFLPGYSLFRVPSRALYFVVVGGAGLTALFITDLLSATPDERERVLRPAVRWGLPLTGLFCMVGAFALSAYFTTFSADAHPPWRTLYSANMTALAAVSVGAAWMVIRQWCAAGKCPPPWIGGLTLVVVIVDLWHIAAPLVTVKTIDVPDMWQALAGAVPPGPDYRVMTMPQRIEWQAGSAYLRQLNASGYDPLVSGAYQRLLGAGGDDPTSPIARLLGVRYIVTDQPYPANTENLRLIKQDSGWYIYERADVLPRVFLAPTAQVMEDDQTALTQLASGGIDPLQTAIVHQPVDCVSAEASALAGTARIVQYTPNTVEIHAQSAQPVLLVLTDSYDSQWAVTIDGAPADLLRIYTALRGVCLPTGEHRVRLEYQPKIFTLGLLISGVSWIMLALVSWWQTQWLKRPFRSKS